jgi:WD40 repeat protein
VRFPYTYGLKFAFSPDGTRVAAGTSNFVRVWDLQNPDQPAGLSLPNGSILALGFSSHDLRLRVGDVQGAVVEWHFGSRAADLLCSRVWRNLSISEWKANVGEDIPYESTCPNLPPGAGASGGPR